MSESGNGRTALEHSLKGITDVESGCRELAIAAPDAPSMEHCPNKEFTQPYYAWHSKAIKALLFAVAELSAWRKDDISRAIQCYDEAKNAGKTHPGTQSVESVIEIPVPYSQKTIRIPKSILIGMVLAWIALVSFGIDPMVYFRVKQHEKARLFNELGNTNLVLMEVSPPMNLRLGKLPALVDPRTIPLMACLDSRLPPIPRKYLFDAAHKTVTFPTPMFANDRYGCCVIASEAHQTLRFEHVEQGGVLNISSKEVVDRYFALSGGKDSGLVMLNALKAWREGWTAAGKTYKIDAFGALDPRNPKSIKTAIFLLRGIQVGLWLPQSASTQLRRKQEWSMVLGPTAQKGSWGGHCVYVLGYNADGLWCVTWGQLQFMTREFFEAYCDEAYGVVDSLDDWRKRPGIDPVKMNRYLREAQNS